MVNGSQLAADGRFAISRQFSFDAAHHLNGLGPDHKCSRLHGHGYRVEVVVTAKELTAPGFVTDFGDLAPFGLYLAQNLDHRDLNEVLTFEPTSELLARHLAFWFIEHVEPVVPGYLVAVRVSETASSWAQFTVDRS